MSKGRILAVDDTPASLRLLTDLLKAEGYEVRSAINGNLALESAFGNPPELVLLDICMPEMDGFEVCRRLKANAKTNEVPVIFISALAETDEKLQGFELGAVDYVTKPYQRQELLARVHAHVELTRLRSHLEVIVQERTEELRQKEEKLRTSLIDFITALSATLEMRDPYTAGHQRRVAHLATAIAIELGLSQDQINGLYLSSVVHDFGKILVPAEILSKPGRLNDLEYGLIKMHPQTGHEILKGIDFPWPIAQTVLQHHERQSGNGYPRGLKDSEILPEAKILAVADVVEAMVSHRPYRAGLGVEVALQELRRNRGELYDPVVVDACLSLFLEKGYQLPA